MFDDATAALAKGDAPRSVTDADLEDIATDVLAGLLAGDEASARMGMIGEAFRRRKIARDGPTRNHYGGRGLAHRHRRCGRSISLSLTSALTGGNLQPRMKACPIRYRPNPVAQPAGL
jgi:hypothetical protein